MYSGLHIHKESVFEVYVCTAPHIKNKTVENADRACGIQHPYFCFCFFQHAPSSTGKVKTVLHVELTGN